eukprot:453886-Hanusia_phi.AAC.3
MVREIRDTMENKLLKTMVMVMVTMIGHGVDGGEKARLVYVREGLLIKSRLPSSTNVKSPTTVETFCLTCMRGIHASSILQLRGGEGLEILQSLEVDRQDLLWNMTETMNHWLLNEFGVDFLHSSRTQILCCLDRLRRKHRDRQDVHISPPKRLVKADGSWKEEKLTRDGVQQRFFLACEAGDKEVFLDSLSKGAGLDRTDWAGFTALHYAVSHVQPGIVSMLLTAGVDVNRADNNGFTPLMLAAAYRSRLLIDQLVITGKADVNFQMPFNSSLPGASALHLAAKTGVKEVCMALLEGGAHINMVDAFGRTPADWAAMSSHVKLQEFLTEYSGIFEMFNETFAYINKEKANLTDRESFIADMAGWNLNARRRYKFEYLRRIPRGSVLLDRLDPVKYQHCLPGMPLVNSSIAKQAKYADMIDLDASEDFFPDTSTSEEAGEPVYCNVTEKDFEEGNDSDTDSSPILDLNER